MQIPILNGIYADTTGEFRTTYPRNLIPVPKKQGISNGYLRPADGIVEFATGPGVDRGGINWNGVCYRVMGKRLVKVNSDGSINDLGYVGNVNPASLGPVTFDYSFDRLAVCADGFLYYWNGTTLTLVNDPDLGTVIDFIWVDGYFMTTDGTYLVVTELNDPLSINPLKYGSAESDPDPIKGLIKIRNEVYAVGRYTIEVLDNIGGELFPFQRVSGAQIMRGAVGTYALAAMTIEQYAGIAFIGSGRNEALAIWFGANGATTKLSTREIETVLEDYTETQLSQAILETRVDKTHSFLYVHLPDQTLVYDANASAALQEPIWFVLTSSIVGKGQYRARNLIRCYDKWISGDPTTSKLGYFVDNISSHYGDVNGWEFGTMIIYNEANGILFHELELIALTGNYESGKTPTIWTCYSTDGVNWSQERPRTVGRLGQRDKRLNWLQQGNMKNWRIQKFRGTSEAHISIARLEARLEALGG